MITCLVPPEELSGRELFIIGDSYRHLFRSRRLAQGARLRLTDGQGKARWGEVAAVGPRSAEILLGEGAPNNEPPRAVKLFVAVPRLQRASWLVEKATELGVEAIHFLDTERTSHRLSGSNLERLRRVASSALEQCHGSSLPSMTGPQGMREALPFVESCKIRRFLDLPRAGGEPGVIPLSSSAALFVGPEGGWTDGERKEFGRWDCHSWDFGWRVLRLETAAIVGLGLVLCSSVPASLEQPSGVDTMRP